jgi:hypothetical protein
MELQEMDVDGQDNTEPGGSNDDKNIFHEVSPSFPANWYETFPLTQQLR